MQISSHAESMAVGALVHNNEFSELLHDSILSVFSTSGAWLRNQTVQ